MRGTSNGAWGAAWGAAVGLVAVVASFAGPRPAAADLHKDEQLGYTVQVPNGWRQIPIAGEEKYIVGKFQSDREYVERLEGWSHRPELKVILFDPKAKMTGQTQAGDTTVVRIENPYKTFKDFVKSDGEGGRYISEEKDTTVNGAPTTWYEVKYEKLTVARHGLAFVYHADDIDYCAYYEVLEQYWEKLQPMLLASLKSFKLIPRKGTVTRETTGDDRVSLVDDTSKLTPEERAKARLERFERELRIAQERLPEGWSVKRSKNYVVITHVDDKYTAKVIEQAEAIRAWADATLPFWGNGIPGPALLRVCKDNAEQSAFSDLSARSRNRWAWSTEIVLSRDDGFWGFERVADAVFDRWLHDKNPGLSPPPWLSRGLHEWVYCGYVRAGRLEFRPDGGLIVALKLAAKKKKLVMPRTLLQTTASDLNAEFEAMGSGMPSPEDMLASRMSPSQQAGGFIRYLLAGPGRTNPRTKDLLKAYVLALDEVVRANDAKPTELGAAPAAPKTEEEEEERFKSRETYWKDREKDLLKAVFDKVFGQWTEADWAAIDKSYAAFAS